MAVSEVFWLFLEYVWKLRLRLLSKQRGRNQNNKNCTSILTGIGLAEKIWENEPCQNQNNKNCTQDRKIRENEKWQKQQNHRFEFPSFFWK